MPGYKLSRLPAELYKGTLTRIARRYACLPAPAKLQNAMDTGIVFNHNSQLHRARLSLSKQEKSTQTTGGLAPRLAVDPDIAKRRPRWRQQRQLREERAGLAGVCGEPGGVRVGGRPDRYIGSWKRAHSRQGLLGRARGWNRRSNIFRLAQTYCWIWILG